jgi:hypothetical protein
LASTERPLPLPRVLAVLFLFAISFAYVEAAATVYLRALYEPIHQHYFPGRTPGDLLPLVRLEQLQAREPQALHWVGVELTRQLATVLMLAAVGAAVARNFRQGLAAFMIAFGLWDIFFYLFLKLFIDWPASPGDWDLLFLLPVPWVGPVWAPLAVAISMVAAGVLVLHREAAGRPVRLGWQQAATLAAGGAIIVLAFCWDYENTLVAGQPKPFQWPLFAAGLAIGWLGLWHGCTTPAHSTASS